MESGFWQGAMAANPARVRPDARASGCEGRSRTSRWRKGRTARLAVLGLWNNTHSARSDVRPDVGGPRQSLLTALGRFARRLSVHSGRQPDRRVPPPFHFQCIPHRGTCGKPLVVPHNRRPKLEPTEMGVVKCGCCCRRMGRAGTSNRWWDSRCGCGHSARRCGCARRRS